MSLLTRTECNVIIASLTERIDMYQNKVSILLDQQAKTESKLKEYKEGDEMYEALSVALKEIKRFITGYERSTQHHEALREKIRRLKP